MKMKLPAGATSGTLKENTAFVGALKNAFADALTASTSGVAISSDMITINDIVLSSRRLSVSSTSRLSVSSPTAGEESRRLTEERDVQVGSGSHVFSQSHLRPIFTHLRDAPEIRRPLFDFVPRWTTRSRWSRDSPRPLWIT